MAPKFDLPAALVGCGRGTLEAAPSLPKELSAVDDANEVFSKSATLFDAERSAEMEDISSSSSIVEVEELEGTAATLPSLRRADEAGGRTRVARDGPLTAGAEVAPSPTRVVALMSPLVSEYSIIDFECSSVNFSPASSFQTTPFFSSKATVLLPFRLLLLDFRDKAVGFRLGRGIVGALEEVDIVEVMLRKAEEGFCVPVGDGLLPAAVFAARDGRCDLPGRAEELVEIEKGASGKGERADVDRFLDAVEEVMG